MGATPEALARTYSHPSYADPWDVVEDYQRVLEYAGANPNAGSAAVASALELPRSRIRPWLNDAIPDCVRAIQVAEAKDWLTTDDDSAVFRGLNVFVAWIFSGGSINANYVPYFAIRDDADRTVLARAAAVTDITLDTTRSPSASGRAQELRPTDHASVLGRVLSVLGAPVGAKTPAATMTLPDYLDDAPQRVREEFVQVYLHNRGQDHPESDVQMFREARSQTYLHAIADLIEAVTGGSVTVSDKNVILSTAATREIASWPALLGR